MHLIIRTFVENFKHLISNFNTKLFLTVQVLINWFYKLILLCSSKKTVMYMYQNVSLGIPQYIYGISMH